MKIRAGDGCEELGHPEMLSTPLFYFARPGDKLVLLDTEYKFNIATYRPEIEPQWLYTYTYASDQSWTIYNRDLTGDRYRQDDYVFEKRVYFRICLRKINGDAFDSSDNINEIIAFHTAYPDDLYGKDEEKPTPTSHVIASARSNPDPSLVSGIQKPISDKPWLYTEVNRISQRVTETRESDDLVFALLADSHYNVNGTWEDTQNAIEQLCREIKLDGIIHLGDMSDGMVTGEATKHYVISMLDGLRKCGVPVWIALGNHDTNYFRKNSEYFTVEQQRKLYYNGEETRYHIDLPNMRLIFLDSFAVDEKNRYGYTPECAQWLEHTLKSTPNDSRAIILSHLPPLARLQYWTSTLRGEAEIMEILNRHRDKILAWLNGHNHADRLDNDEGFPIISIANAKCEAFSEYKTEGFVTPHRRLGDTTQEAFDLMIVNAVNRKVLFIRFGAGYDRIISNGKAEWYDCVLEH